jgi:hypothetical protein
MIHSTHTVHTLRYDSYNIYFIRNVKYTRLRKSKIENHVTEVSPERTRRFRPKALHHNLTEDNKVPPDKHVALAHRQGNKKAYIHDPHNKNST